MAEARLPRLPDFLIVGAMKAGTSSLGFYLDEHPEVGVPSRELDFFSRDDLWQQGPAAYAALLANCPDKRVMGDRSPDYAYAPAARPSIPQRIAALLPQARIVWCLRNPVERVHSHFWHCVTRGCEWRPLRWALWSESRRPADPYRAYRDRGVYVAQVRQYLQYFPLDRMAFVLTEALHAGPAAELARLYAFLGVDVSFANQRTSERRNPARRLIGPVITAPWVISYLRGLRPKRRRLLLERWGWCRPAMAEDIRRQLQAFYRPFNEQLAALTGLDLSAWEEV